MKAKSLFLFGGIALLLSAILNGTNNLIYFLSGQPDDATALVYWIAFFADTLSVFGLGALFARQAERSGILGLVGYILLVQAILFFIASYGVGLGVAAGVLSMEQISQVPAYTLTNSILPWIWFAGLIFFGVSIYRAEVLAKYAGALLILLALVKQLTGPLAFTRPIFAVLSFAAWAWLGWSLLQNREPVSSSTPSAA